MMLAISGPNWRSPGPYSYSLTISTPNLGAASLKPATRVLPKSVLMVRTTAFFLPRILPTTMAPARPCTSPTLVTRNM